MCGDEEKKREGVIFWLPRFEGGVIRVGEGWEGWDDGSWDEEFVVHGYGWGAWEWASSRRVRRTVLSGQASRRSRSFLDFCTHRDC